MQRWTKWTRNGTFPGAVLSIADDVTESISDYVRETPHIRYDRDDKDVLAVFKQNRERAVAVLDEDEDLLQLLEEARGHAL